MKHLTLLVLSIWLVAACKPSTNVEKLPGYSSTPSGLQFKIIEEGSGAAIADGDEVMIEEEVSYRNGTILYSNVGGPSVKVKIGAGQVTEATEESLLDMKAGETREVIAPPHLVKRKVYPPGLSPDSALVLRITAKEIL